MEEQGAKRHSITAALGPCIGPCHYEVTDEFYNQFIDCNNEFQNIFKNRKINHFHFNLWAFIMNQLKEAGINAFVWNFVPTKMNSVSSLIGVQYTGMNLIMDDNFLLLP